MRTFQHSETCADLWAAKAKAKGEFHPLVKSKTAKVKNKNGEVIYEYHYADLADIFNSITPALSTNGLSVGQSFEVDDQGQTYVDTFITHASGQWEKWPGLPMATTKLLTLQDGSTTSIPLTPQEQGSETTYKRRYPLCSAFGIQADEDEDGALATDAAKESAKAVQTASKRTSKPDPEPETPVTEITVRSSFHKEAQDAGWSLSDRKMFLQKNFNEYRTNVLSETQLSEALVYFKKHTPAEITPENPITDDDLPAGM